MFIMRCTPHSSHGVRPPRASLGLPSPTIPITTLHTRLTQALSDKQIRLIACGEGYTTAVTRDNEVYWWGRRDGSEDPAMPMLVSLSESIKGGTALLGPGIVAQLVSHHDHTIVVAATRNLVGLK
eukprot:m.170654 g.170654  ORF g.170654 m.170654 type:complete len:125 (+) comp9929_c0_seq6:1862-2236(+)